MFLSNFRKKSNMYLNKKRLSEQKEELKTLPDLSKRRRRLKPTFTKGRLSKKEWKFIPIVIHHGEDENISIRFRIRNERDRDDRALFFESLKESHCFFQNTKGFELPSIVDLTTPRSTTDDEVVIALPSKQFETLQMLNYTRYLVSFVGTNLRVKGLQEYVPQFPLLIRMYNSHSEDGLESQRMICFLKIIREWVIHNVKDFLTNDGKIQGINDRLKEETQEEQLSLAKNLHTLLNGIFRYFKEDTTRFAGFFQTESIGVMLIYHFLFVDLINRVDPKLVGELHEFFLHLGIGNHALRSRHLSLVLSINAMDEKKKDLICLDIDAKYNRVSAKPIVFKVQLYSLLCDIQMDPEVSMAVMCYLSSSVIVDSKREQMVEFASKLQTPYNKKQYQLQLREASLEMFLNPTNSFDIQEAEKLSKMIISSQTEKKMDLIDHHASRPIPSSQKHGATFSPFSYSKNLKKTSLPSSSSSSSRIEPIYMIAFFHFIRGLENNTIMKSKCNPQVLSCEEYNDLTNQFPIGLISPKTYAYMDNVYLSQY